MNALQWWWFRRRHLVKQTPDVLQFNIMLTPEQVDEVRRRFRWGKSEGVGGQQPS